MGLKEHLTGVEGEKYTALLSALLWQSLSVRQLQENFKTPIAIKKRLKTLHIAAKLSVTLNKILELGLVERIDKDEIKDVVVDGVVRKRYYTGRWRFNFAALTPLAQGALELWKLQSDTITKAWLIIFDNPKKADLSVHPELLVSNCKELLTIISNELKATAILFNHLSDFQSAISISEFEGKTVFNEEERQLLSNFEKRLNNCAAQVIKERELPSVLANVVKETINDKSTKTIIFNSQRLPYNFDQLNTIIKIVCDALDAEVGYVPFPNIEVIEGVSQKEFRENSLLKLAGEYANKLSRQEREAIRKENEKERQKLHRQLRVS